MFVRSARMRRGCSAWSALARCRSPPMPVGMCRRGTNQGEPHSLQPRLRVGSGLLKAMAGRPGRLTLAGRPLPAHVAAAGGPVAVAKRSPSDRPRSIRTDRGGTAELGYRECATRTAVRPAARYAHRSDRTALRTQRTRRDRCADALLWRRRRFTLPAGGRAGCPLKWTTVARSCFAASLCSGRPIVARGAFDFTFMVSTRHESSPLHRLFFKLWQCLRSGYRSRPAPSGGVRFPTARGLPCPPLEPIYGQLCWRSSAATSRTPIEGILLRRYRIQSTSGQSTAVPAESLRGATQHGWLLAGALLRAPRVGSS